MKLIEPKVELLSELDISPESHIARCARVCYGFEYKEPNQAELCYRYMIDDGMKPEDARGVLPLDTATKVIYTYSVQEWKHIIDLRYYDTTGRPHPNAKLVIGMVREQINQFAKENNIDFKV